MAATRRAESEDDETADTAHLGEVARTARREDDLMDVTMARSRCVFLYGLFTRGVFSQN